MDCVFVFALQIYKILHTKAIAIPLIIKRIAIFLYYIFSREDGRDCGGVSTRGHGQREGPARYEFRDSGTK